MFGDDALFEKLVREGDAIEADENKNVDETKLNETDVVRLYQDYRKSMEEPYDVVMKIADELDFDPEDVLYTLKQEGILRAKTMEDLEADKVKEPLDRKASAARWAEDIHPELSPSSKERYVADVDEQEEPQGIKSKIPNYDYDTSDEELDAIYTLADNLYPEASDEEKDWLHEVMEEISQITDQHERDKELDALEDTDESKTNEEVVTENAEDLLDIANSKLGWAVADQLKRILENPTKEGIDDGDFNPNALRMIYKFLYRRDDDLSQEVREAIEDWVEEGWGDSDVLGGLEPRPEGGEKVEAVDESTLEVVEKSFDDVEDIKGRGGEGIVCLGAGGDPQDWIDGIIKMWQEEGIFEGTAEEAFSEVFKLTSTGGRTDLVMVFDDDASLDMGKMAMWRLRFGECSWISDFVDNYASHYGKENHDTGLDDEDDANLDDEDQFESKTIEEKLKEAQAPFTKEEIQHAIDDIKDRVSDASESDFEDKESYESAIMEWENGMDKLEDELKDAPDEREFDDYSAASLDRNENKDGEKTMNIDTVSNDPNFENLVEAFRREGATPDAEEEKVEEEVSPEMSAAIDEEDATGVIVTRVKEWIGLEVSDDAISAVIWGLSREPELLDMIAKLDVTPGDDLVVDQPIESKVGEKVDEQLVPRSDDLLFIDKSAFEDTWQVLTTREGSNTATVMFTFVDEETAAEAGAKIADAIGGEYRGKEDPRIDPSAERSPRQTIEKKEVKESYGPVYIKADIDKGLSKEEIIKRIQDRYPDIGDEQAGQIHDKVEAGKDEEADWSRGDEEKEEVKEDSSFLPRGEIQQLIDAWELIGSQDDDSQVRIMADEKVEELLSLIASAETGIQSSEDPRPPLHQYIRNIDKEED